MCGIAVVFSKSKFNPIEEGHLRQMLCAMEHRGPDNQGIFIDKTVGLAMNRLAITGVETGDQPIWNENETVVVVCNGEIYNHHELRDQLQKEGHSFSTDSDVEVIVHLYEQYGIKCLELLNGIFAFALWDQEKQCLLVARDAMGVKPLYYVDTGTHIYFASETQPLIRHIQQDVHFDVQGFSDYHTFRFTPGNRTTLRGLKKLQPAQYMIFKENKINKGFYWGPQSDNFPSTHHRMDPTRNQIDTVRNLLIDAVRNQFAPEVKSGILLSGGLDSSAILAIHHQFSQERPNTFTVSFERPGIPIERDQYSEIDQAARVAEAFHSNHIAEVYSAREALEALTSIIGSLSEPIADPTIIPLWFVSRLASQEGCKVVFSGEGLDELFNGYQVYKQIYWLRALQWMPRYARQLAHTLSHQLQLPARGLLKRTLSPPWEWYQGIGSVFTREELKQILQKEIWDLIQNENPQNHVEKLMQPVRNESVLKQMTHFDVFAWLPENTFMKSDNVTMAHSLELRVPFVDLRLAEYALQVKDNLKLRWGTGKWIVKQAMKALLPDWVLKRRKAGFPVPLTAWVFHEWKDFILTTLLDPNASTRGLYKKEEIVKLYEASDQNRWRVARLIWTLLTFELWCQAKKAGNEMPFDKERAGKPTPSGLR
jgi:asparagine synthase (glutamine-hydrolysing)